MPWWQTAVLDHFADPAEIAASVSPIWAFQQEHPNDIAGYRLRVAQWWTNPVAWVVSVLNILRLTLLSCIDLLGAVTRADYLMWRDIAKWPKGIFSGIFACVLLPLRGLEYLWNLPTDAIYYLYRLVIGNRDTKLPDDQLPGDEDDFTDQRVGYRLHIEEEREDSEYERMPAFLSERQLTVHPGYPHKAGVAPGQVCVTIRGRAGVYIWQSHFGSPPPLLSVDAKQTTQPKMENTKTESAVLRRRLHAKKLLELQLRSGRRALNTTAIREALKEAKRADKLLEVGFQMKDTTDCELKLQWHLEELGRQEEELVEEIAEQKERGRQKDELEPEFRQLQENLASDEAEMQVMLQKYKGLIQTMLVSLREMPQQPIASLALLDSDPSSVDWALPLSEPDVQAGSPHGRGSSAAEFFAATGRRMSQEGAALVDGQVVASTESHSPEKTALPADNCTTR